MHIRVATAADAAAIARVHVAAWQVAYRGLIPDDLIAARDITCRTERWREILAQPDGVTFVSEEPEIITGFCNLLPSRDADAKPGTTAEITSIYVHPQHWRMGAGRALCREAFEEAKNRRFVALTLWVMKTNSLAIKFYETIGFVADGGIKIEKLKDFELHEIRFRLAVGPTRFLE